MFDVIPTLQLTSVNIYAASGFQLYFIPESEIIHAIQFRILILCPGVPENMKLPQKFLKKKSTNFLRSNKVEGLAVNDYHTSKCCIYSHVPIISGIPVVINHHS